MDLYQKKARAYPAVLTTILPALYVITTNNDLDWYIRLFNQIGWYKIFPLSVIVLLFGAIGFCCSELIAVISKIFPLFKEDETQMPTTNLLIYRTSNFTESHIDLILNKIFQDFGKKMPNKSDQIEDEKNSRKAIAEAVPLIREVTRKDPILLMINIRYGFFRNFLGGFVLAEALMLTFYFIPGLKFAWNWWLFVIVPWVGFIMSFICMRICARQYARQLYASYLKQPSLN